MDLCINICIVVFFRATVIWLPTTAIIKRKLHCQEFVNYQWKIIEQRKFPYPPTYLPTVHVPSTPKTTNACKFRREANFPYSTPFTGPHNSRDYRVARGRKIPVVRQSWSTGNARVRRQEGSYYSSPGFLEIQGKDPTVSSYQPRCSHSFSFILAYCDFRYHEIFLHEQRTARAKSPTHDCDYLNRSCC